MIDAQDCAVRGCAYCVGEAPAYAGLMTTMTPDEVGAALPDWRYRDGFMELSIDAGSFMAAIEFVNEVARLAEAQNHHPDIDVRYARVRLAVRSHDVDALTDRDVTLGKAVSAVVEDRALKVVG